MKKYILLIVFAVITVNLQAQNEPKVKEGTVLEIGNVAQQNYEHIVFPRANFIIKRGGIVSYHNILGTVVKVTAIKKQADGTHILTITRADRGRFFGSHHSVTAHLEKALESGELIIP